nr:MAG TPA: hypothetical protein [Caudoviricetes sp.]
MCLNIKCETYLCLNLVNAKSAKFGDKKSIAYLCSAYQKSLADKLNMLYLSGFCHSMIYPIQYSESD